MIYAQNIYPETLGKGVFVGENFVAATVIYNVYFSKATSQVIRKTNWTSSAVELAGYP